MTAVDTAVRAEVARLVDAAKLGDRRRFGLAYNDVLALGQPVEAAGHALAELELRVLGWIAGRPDIEVDRVHQRITELRPAWAQLIEVNQVVLELVARSVIGASDYVEHVDPELVCLYAALLAGVVGTETDPAPPAGSEETAPAGDTPMPAGAGGPGGTEGPGGPGETEGPEGPDRASRVGASSDAIQAAIRAVTLGDADRWQRSVRTALAEHEPTAVAAAGAALNQRLAGNDLGQDGLVSPIVVGSTRMAAATEDGPLACPAWLFEIAVRRALSEPGCLVSDDAEFTFAATEACGLLDLHDAVLPAGWGWAVHLPVDPHGERPVRN